MTPQITLVVSISPADGKRQHGDFHFSWLALNLIATSNYRVSLWLERLRDVESETKESEKCCPAVYPGKRRNGFDGWLDNPCQNV